MSVCLYFILLGVSISAEVITLIKDQKLTCVITEDSLYNAIEVVPWVELKRPVAIVDNWTLVNDWKFCDNTECVQTFDFITDQRWEHMRVQCSEPPLPDKMYQGAVKLKEYRQFLSLYSNSTTLIKISTQHFYGTALLNIIFELSEWQWSHFSFKRNGTYFEIIGENVSKNVSLDFKPEWISFENTSNKTCRKLHKYKFIYSNSSGESKIPIGLLKCVFMYVSVDENCVLEVKFEKNGNSVNKTIEGFNQDKTLRKWKKFNITNNSDGPGYLHLHKRNGTSKTGCFWAVSEIQKCRIRTEFYSIDLRNDTEQQHNLQICRTVKGNYNKSTAQITFSNKVFDCSEVLGTSYPNCEKHKICLENGTCACVWGYKGTFCNETCQSGFWGLNCSNFYETDCGKCDPVIGCTKCKGNFTGDQCENNNTLSNTTQRTDKAETAFNDFPATKNVAIINSSTASQITSPKQEEKIGIVDRLVVAVSVTFFIVVAVVTTIVIIILLSCRKRKQTRQEMQRNDVVASEDHSQCLLNYSVDNHENCNQNCRNRQREGGIELQCTNNIFKHLFRRDMSIRITNNFQKQVETFLNDIDVLEQLINYLNKITLSNFVCILSEEEKTKNRFRAVLPGKSQVFLPASLAKSSTYINAITVDCYNHPKKFIVTQQPLPNTIEDFWILIRGYKINTIVSLNHEHDAHCPKFWPNYGEPSMLISDFCHIVYVNNVDTNLYSITEVIVNNKRRINIIIVKKWNRESTTPESVTVLLEIWDRLRTNSGQIVVTCYDGATASGLFVALAFLLEKINKKNICDVVAAVRTVKQSRFLFVQYSEQLKFLFEAALIYVQSFSSNNRY